MRILGALTAGAVLMGGATALAADRPAPDADLAHHGHVVLHAGRADVRLAVRNHGPSSVDDATVRLRWSEPLADRQALPRRCARSDAWTVVCGTGALAADGLDEVIRLRVRLKGAPSEVLLEIGTAWAGGAIDRNHRNDHQHVLALDTGDTYRF
ncbi:hypothetical protein [Streptomyces poonensis]|nr:hypothetical protein [Streptomyces poonensis]